jgi:hypothetical protein
MKLEGRDLRSKSSSMSSLPWLALHSVEKYLRQGAFDAAAAWAPPPDLGRILQPQFSAGSNSESVSETESRLGIEVEDS